MNSTKILAAAALSLLAAAGAHAETYEGVHQLTSNTVSRADVRVEARNAIRNVALHGEAVALQGAPVLPTPADRATVRAQAVAAAHAPNQNLRAEAFAGSTVPAQYGNGVTFTRQAGL